MPVNTTQRITERHAKIIHQREEARGIGARTAADTFIGEIDGCMVPVVETAPSAEDKRKGKTLPEEGAAMLGASEGNAPRRCSASTSPTA